MRTLIVSDLHLGNGGDYEAFAGKTELVALLDRFAASPARVIVNGDGIDFLMNDDPLRLDAKMAEKQAKAIAGAKATASVLAALGRVLSRGGEVVVRIGNHDVELALPEVQDVFRSALRVPDEVSARLRFQLGETPELLDVGGARILVTHGQDTDPWNRVDHATLATAPRDYAFAPGSELVKRFLNPLTRDHQLRFANLLKPDFRGGTLAALAIAPGAVGLLFQRASLDILWQLFRRLSDPTAYPAAEPGSAPLLGDLGLADLVDTAGLVPEEEEALGALLIDPASYGGVGQPAAAERARLKLARVALAIYARVQRRLVGADGKAYFELTPEREEWDEAQRLARTHGAGAVILGHTHAARFRHDKGLVFANAGTWIWLMQLPAFEAGDEAWAEFLEELEQNRELAPERQKAARLLGRFTAVTIEEHPEGGAEVALIEAGSAGEKVLGSARVGAAG